MVTKYTSILCGILLPKNHFCLLIHIHIFPCDKVTPINGYCKRVMTSTAERKRVFKNYKLHTKN